VDLDLFVLMSLPVSVFYSLLSLSPSLRLCMEKDWAFACFFCPDRILKALSGFSPSDSLFLSLYPFGVAHPSTLLVGGVSQKPPFSNGSQPDAF